MRTVVGRIKDNGIIRDTRFVEGFQDFADMRVVLDHPVRVLSSRGQSRLVPEFGFHVRVSVHPGAVVPAEKRLARFRLSLDELDGSVGSLVIDRLHPFSVERTGVLDRLFADAAPAWLLSGGVLVGGLAAQHAARTEFFSKLGSRIGATFRLFLGVEMVEVAKELVEAMNSRQILVQVYQMILPELAGVIALALQQLGYRHVPILETRGGAGDIGRASCR